MTGRPYPDLLADMVFGPAGLREIAVRTILRVADGIGLYIVGLIVMLVTGELPPERGPCRTTGAGDEDGGHVQSLPPGSGCRPS